MGYVTTYLVINNNYNEVEYGKVINKIKELFNDDNNDNRDTATTIPEYNSFGDKGAEIDCMFFGLNYFNNDLFDIWYYQQEFEDVLVLRRKENEDRFENFSE